VTFHRLSADDTRVTVQMDWQPGGVVEKAAGAMRAAALDTLRRLNS